VSGADRQDDFLVETREVLRAGHIDYVINDVARDYICHHNLAGPRVQKLVSHTNRAVAYPDHQPRKSLYSDRLRRNWRSVGLTGIFDVAAAVESKATGYWNAEGAPGYGAAADVLLI